MILLVASNKDIASLNIKEQILKHYPFNETAKVFQQNPTYIGEIGDTKTTLITLKDESTKAQSLPEDFPSAKLIVFISRHSSQSGKPTLSVHTTGNFGDAELGGLPKTLSIAPASFMQNALKSLMRQKEILNLDYAVSFECTHHGPSLNVPTMFVELGSSPPQWHDSIAAQAVANAAIASIVNFKAPITHAFLGIGGTHYNQKFTLMSLSGKEAFGHMIPKYAVSLVDEDMLRQCVERTFEKVSLALLDWKGIKSEDKPNLIAALKKVGLIYKKV
jgi:D-tyrosyl-tRNA(Tyr) deacylase